MAVSGGPLVAAALLWRRWELGRGGASEGSSKGRDGVADRAGVDPPAVGADDGVVSAGKEMVGCSGWERH